MEPYAVVGTLSEQARAALAEHPDRLAQLLHARGLTDADAARAFLNPSYDEHLHDPFLLPDMSVAVKRIIAALEKNERIAIYSDYDCDGIPGGTILHDLFSKLGYEHFENYIPHRHKEGYGLNTDALDALSERGAQLVITVDCGIADNEQVAHATALGMDVIVTDHHEPQEELPPAYAVINPKRADSGYPFDGLCGSGVAYKLAQAVLHELPTSDFNPPTDIKAGWEKWWLDMVGLATIADMVPLVGENRVLAHYGLQVLRKSPRPGLSHLCRKMRVTKRFITEDDVGFMIAPRINAASRMDKPEAAFQLLTEQDEEKAGALAGHLDKINNERKGMVAAMVRDLKKRMHEREELKSVIVLGNPDWRPALLGLAANSLVEQYARPVFLWGREGGAVIKGSCRSDGSVDLVELMAAKADLFLEYGGHKFSGGFSLAQDNIYYLEDALNEAYAEVFTEMEAGPKHTVDAELELDEVSWELYDQIKKLAPFGLGNPKPLFAFPRVQVAQKKYFGKEKNHVELGFKKQNGTLVPAIQFFAPDRFADINEGDTVTLIANIERGQFSAQPHLRLRIVDVV